MFRLAVQQIYVNRFISFLILTLLLGFFPSNVQPAFASGAPTFSGFTTPISANEQTPTPVFPGITFSDTSTDYAGKWIEFTFDTSTAADRLVLETSTAASVTLNAISVVGSTVFKGNGTSATAIGTIDSTDNGTSGKKLRVNFTNTFTNGGFSDSRTTTVGDVVSLSGWTAYERRVRLAGASTVGEWPTPTDNAFPARTDTTANKDSSTAGNTFTVNTSYAGRSGGGYSVQLATSGSCANGFCIIRGPYIVSNDPVYLQEGDSVSFWWSALGASDAYDVYGYLLNTDNGNTIQLLNATGANGSATQPWKVETTTVTTGQAGNYKFVFVGGTWDASGGQVEGASLLIDDVAVSVSNSASITDADVANLSALLRYEETSDAPVSSRTIRIATSTSATGGVQTITVNAVNDLITMQTPTKITRLRDMSDSSTATGTLLAYDPDLGVGVSINPNYGATGATFNATNGKLELNAQYGKFSIDSATGAYTYEFFVDTITALNADVSETINVTATAGSETAAANLIVRLFSPTRTIAFTTPGTLAVTKANGDLFPIVATPSAGDDDGTISYSVGASTGCAIVATNVKITAATGTCTVTATISAGTYWSGATTSSPLVVTIGSGGGGSSAPTGSPTQYPQPNFLVIPQFSALEGKPYSLQIQAVHTEQFELQGSLPPGLSLNSSTGIISGTPTTSGSFRFVIILRGKQVGIGQTFDFVVNAPEKPEIPPSLDFQEIPQGEFGNPWITVNSQAIPAAIVPNKSENGMEVRTASWYLTISAVQENGIAAKLLGLPGQQSLVFIEKMKAYVGGSGFRPNSKVRVHLFNPTITLGEMVTDSKGEFSGLFDLPLSINDGSYMIQVNGISPRNELRSASISFLYEKIKMAAVAPVETPKEEVTTAPSPTPKPSTENQAVTFVVPFAFNEYKIAASQTRLIKQISSKRGAQVKIVGYAQPSRVQPDILISLNRAIEVKKSISKFLPKAQFNVSGSGSKTNPLCAPYKNKCVVIYVKP